MFPYRECPRCVVHCSHEGEFCEGEGETQTRHTQVWTREGETRSARFWVATSAGMKLKINTDKFWVEEGRLEEREMKGLEIWR